MGYKDQIDLLRLPQHIAIIMDGNGRWAKGKGKLRVFGHRNGVQSVRDVVEGAAELGIKYITLYTFSSENWNRPKLEVSAIMELMIATIHKEINNFMKNNIRLLDCQLVVCCSYVSIGKKVSTFTNRQFAHLTVFVSYLST